MSNGYDRRAEPSERAAAPGGDPCVTPAEARLALARVLAQPPFRSSPRVSAFLQHVAAEGLEGRGSALQQVEIARAVLGRADLDPMIDPAVRVLAGRARRALARHYEGPGASDTVRIEIPRGSFAPVFRRMGERTGIATPLPPPHTPSASGRPLIAIAGAANPSAGRFASPAAAALADALVLAILRSPDCRAVGPAGGPPATAEACRTLGRRLGADYVLAFKVRERGGRVHVEAWLADAVSGAICWRRRSGPHSASPGPFAFADSLAAEIAGAVAGPGGVVHSVAPGRGTRDPVVSLALHRFFRRKLLDDIPGLPTTVRALEAAARRRTDNALVLAALADAYRLNGLWRLGASHRGLEQAVEIALRATALDCRDPLAATVLLNVSIGEPAGLVEARANRVLELSGATPAALNAAGVALAISSGWKEGSGLVRRALTMSGVGDGRGRVVFAIERFMGGDDAGALAELDRMAPPPVVLTPLLRAVPLMRLGHGAEALAEVARARAVDPRGYRDRAGTMRRVGLPEPAVRMILETLGKIDRAAAAAS